MKSSIEDIKKIAQDFLIKNDIEHVALGEPVFYEASYGGSSLQVDHWSVAFKYKVFDIETAFIEINDADKKIIYILTKHGYDFVDGVEEDRVDDDDEDWSDI